MKQMMIRLWVLVLFFVPGWGAARIQFEQTLLDAGVLRPKSRHEYVFKFQNVGDKVLVIHRVIKTCGCTIPKLDREEVPPGESGTIRVYFYTVGFWGPVRKHVVVESNDPAQPRIQLNMLARVEAAVQPAMEQIRIDNLIPGESRETTLRITNRLNEPLALNIQARVPEDLSDQLRVEVTDEPVANRDHMLHFRVTAGDRVPAGRKVTIPVQVRVVGHERDSFKLKLMVQFQPLSTVEPASLFVYRAKSDGARIASFLVTGNGTGTLRLDNLRTNAPVRLKAVSLGKRKVRVDVMSEPGARGRIQGMIRFKAVMGTRFLLMSVPIQGSYR